MSMESVRLQSTCCKQNFQIILSCELMRWQKSSNNELSLKFSIAEYIGKYTNLLRNFVIKIWYENIKNLQNILI